MASAMVTPLSICFGARDLHLKLGVTTEKSDRATLSLQLDALKTLI